MPCGIDHDRAPRRTRVRDRRPDPRWGKVGCMFFVAVVGAATLMFFVLLCEPLSRGPDPRAKQVWPRITVSQVRDDFQENWNEALMKYDHETAEMLVVVTAEATRDERSMLVLARNPDRPRETVEVRFSSEEGRQEGAQLRVGQQVYVRGTVILPRSRDSAFAIYIYDSRVGEILPASSVR